MAPPALAECVKIEVSHDVGRQPGRQRLWRAWFVMLSLSGKGVVWGRCRLRWWAPPGGISCQLHCWSQLREWWKAAALRIMCEVTPGGEEVSSAARCPGGGFLLGMAGGAAGLDPGCPSGQHQALREGSSWRLVMPHFSFVCIAFSEWRHFSVAFYYTCICHCKIQKK